MLFPFQLLLQILSLAALIATGHVSADDFSLLVFISESALDAVRFFAPKVTYPTFGWFSCQGVFAS